MKRYQALEIQVLLMNDDVITSSADDVLVQDNSFGNNDAPFANFFK